MSMPRRQTWIRVIFQSNVVLFFSQADKIKTDKAMIGVFLSCDNIHRLRERHPELKSMNKTVGIRMESGASERESQRLEGMRQSKAGKVLETVSLREWVGERHTEKQSTPCRYKRGREDGRKINYSGETWRDEEKGR